MGLLDKLTSVGGEAKPKTTKRDRPVIDFVGLANYAALSLVQKQIDGLLKQHPVRNTALRYFVTAGRQEKKAPQNVDGREGSDATASVQLRKRASNQALDADTRALCDDLGVTYDKNVQRPETLRIVPELFAKLKDDPALLDRLIDAGAKALGMEPGDIFEHQTELSTAICTDATLDGVFALGANHTDDRVRELLKKVASETVTAKFNGTLAAAFDVVRVELAPTPTEMKLREQAAAAAAAANPDAAPQAGGGLMDQLKASLAAEGGDFMLPPAGGAKRTTRRAK